MKSAMIKMKNRDLTIISGTLLQLAEAWEASPAATLWGGPETRYGKSRLSSAVIETHEVLELSFHVRRHKHYLATLDLRAGISRTVDHGRRQRSRLIRCNHTSR